MIALTEPVRHARLQAIATALDSGSGTATSGARVRIYSGVRPVLTEAPANTALLVELRLPKPCTQSLVAGTLKLITPSEALCQRSGVARWARLFNSDNEIVLDLDVGSPSAAPEFPYELELASTQLLAGGAVQMTSMEFHEP